jgi:hypothetical protein
MRYDVESIDAYMKAIPEDRVDQINRLRQTIKDNLPQGFEEELQYQMIAYVIPLSRYPKGYHVTPNTALQLMAIASQKQTINIYHHGLYVDQKMHDWFVSSYKELTGKKPNMGKSCVRFKEINDHVLKLIAKLCRKITVEDYLKLYESR